jgi:hypothetical protein
MREIGREGGGGKVRRRNDTHIHVRKHEGDEARVSGNMLLLSHQEL